MSEQGLSVWDRIDLEGYLEEIAKTQAPSTVEKEDEPKSGWRKFTHGLYWRTIKALGCIVWIYAPAKLFIGDVDRWVISNVSPSFLWLVDYRFFFFLGMATLALLLLRRWIYVGAIVFILFFPLIVTLWYLPRTLARQKTWMPTIGVLNIIWISFRTIRLTFLASFLFATSAFVIAVDAAKPLQVTSIVVLLGLWATLLARACVASVKPVSFIQSQQSIIAKVQDAAVARNFALPAVSAGQESAALTKMTKAEVDQFVLQASGVVCLYGAGYFLAEQLEKYRRNGISVIFSVLGVALVFLEAIAIFTMANLGVHQLDDRQFEYESAPSFATFVRYSLNSLFPGDINALQPGGQVATWVSVYAGTSVAIVVLILILSLVFSVRSAREDSAATDAINNMRAKSDEYAHHLVSAYGLPLRQLIARLADMGGLVNVWFRFVSDTIGDVRGEDLASPDM